MASLPVNSLMSPNIEYKLWIDLIIYSILHTAVIRWRLTEIRRVWKFWINFFKNRMNPVSPEVTGEKSWFEVISLKKRVNLVWASDQWPAWADGGSIMNRSRTTSLHDSWLSQQHIIPLLPSSSRNVSRGRSPAVDAALDGGVFDECYCLVKLKRRHFWR